MPLIQNTLVKQTCDYDHIPDFYRSTDTTILKS